MKDFRGGNNYPAPPQQYSSSNQPATNTWSDTFSSFSRGLTKGYKNLGWNKREEDDPKDEDASHVCNVLRTYHMEKYGQLPTWLPRDPKKPQPATPQAQPQYPPYGQYGQPPHSRGNSAAGGSLNDMWSTNVQSHSQPQPPAPQSLRATRVTAQTPRPYDNDVRRGSDDPYATQYTQPAVARRPLPSQRAGSDQNTQPAAIPVSQRDRLKSKVAAGSGGRNSPANLQSQQQTYGDSGYSGNQASNVPYVSATDPWSSTGGYDNYGAGGNHGKYGNSEYRQGSGRQR